MNGPINLPLNESIHLSGGEAAKRTSDAVIIRFPGRRNVLSTSWMNGGYREDLGAVFNHQISLEACGTCHAGNGSVQQYLEGVARSLGLDTKTATGLITRAEMKNTSIIAEAFRDLTVTAIVTAGIEKNGGRAGDPASYFENGNSCEPVGGTINTILLIDADLPEYALTRAVMTAAEAKTVALQQLMARSIYSNGIATGSGTDMIVVVADPGSSRHLSNTGKHSKLGELIGRTVIRATTAALEMETGLSPASQRDVLVRLSRFGVTEEDLYRTAAELPGACPDRGTFLEHLRGWSRDPGAVVRVAAALHVVDEAAWGLVPEQVAAQEAGGILCPGEPFPGSESPIRAVCRGITGAVVKGRRGKRSLP
ncbi:adenosylcobinamide amidohydrolase [Methanoregula sp.]|uniref:adenosylcobinamide amidohydrolase n=1 Tax=Methanoregula sp. TaxID=2052170 RepID=UPI002369E101|nr:adenosylcobinamide amidohydrolase [Methanoregula sp.]MDD1686714.1 adenosylcobinamide amidohydrolase [Methanoregula sp.]